MARWRAAARSDLAWRSARCGLEDRPLVPVEVQPAQRVEDLLDVLGGRSLAVGIFDPQHERAALAAREQPVVERGSGAADVERPGRGWSKANAHERPAPMLIGAHVSNAGGLAKAVERGAERGCHAIQIFNQSPRMWRPTAYSRGRLRGVPRGDRGRAKIKARPDPRRVPAQLRLRGRGDPRQVARLADPVAAGRRRRSAPPASCSTPDRPSRATSARRSSAPAR